MEAVGRGYVDEVDVGVVGQSLVAAVGLCDVVCCGEGFGLGNIACRYAVCLGILHGVERIGHLYGDVPGADYSDLVFSHCSVCFCRTGPHRTACHRKANKFTADNLHPAAGFALCRVFPPCPQPLCRIMKTRLRGATHGRGRGDGGVPENGCGRYFSNPASKAMAEGLKSMPLTNLSDSAAPCSRSIPLSSHSTESGP